MMLRALLLAPREDTLEPFSNALRDEFIRYLSKCVALLGLALIPDGTRACVYSFYIHSSLNDLQQCTQ